MSTGFFSGLVTVMAAGTTKLSVPVPADGTKEFTLPYPPTNPALVYMNVNGVDYYAPNITINGAILTWDGPFSISSTDTVTVVV
jgi:hypothetical protein